MSEPEPQTTQVSKKSSVWWGISALLTALFVLVGLVLSIVAMVKGFSKKSPNTTSGVLGVIASLLAVGAMVVQLVFGLALLFGSKDTDLGSITSRSSTMGGGVGYVIDLPEKFTKDQKTDDGERYVYKLDSENQVLAVTNVSCGYNGIENDQITEMLDALKGALEETDTKAELEDELSVTFGGVDNLRIGEAEDFTSGYYADRAFAISLYGERPSDGSELSGEAHILVDNGNVCSVAWLGTKEIADKNDSKMDEALTSFRAD